MKTLFSSLVALLLGCHLYFCGSFSGLAYAETSNTGPLKAMCRINPNTRLASGLPRVYGRILFEQSDPKEKLTVTFRLSGFPDDKQPRAMHIHEYGDIRKGCDSTGGHYNPLEIDHPQHPGDFGNFVSNNGKIRHSQLCNATLFGKLSIIGRSVVIHEGKDDLGRGGNVGSLLHGNAGRRLACCVIGLSNPKY